MPITNRPKVFLSYARGDRIAVGELYQKLWSAGIEAWYDEVELVPGLDWQHAILDAIEQTDVFLVLVGEGVPSALVEQERHAALEKASRDHRPRIVPVLLPRGKIERLPEALRGNQAIDLRQSIEPHRELARLAAALVLDLDSGKPAEDEVIGDRLRENADPRTALQHYETALRSAVLQVGERHPTVSSLHRKIGITYAELGEFGKAHAEFEKVLTLDETVFGLESPQVSRDLNNLGSVLQAQGDLESAQAHYERALAIDEQAYGAHHSTVAIRLNNLGGVLQAQGDSASAQAHYERALAIDERFYGPQHPNTAITLNNLASILEARGDLQAARKYYESALATAEATYGPEHPTVAIRLNNLGSVLQAQGDLAGAQAHYERALAIDEQAYGSRHPTVAIRLNNLGSVLQAQGSLVRAQALYRRALAIDEAVYGSEHPEVAIDVNNLGNALRALGDLVGARACYERALAINRTVYGQEHPMVTAVAQNLRDVPDISRDLIGAQGYAWQTGSITLSWGETPQDLDLYLFVRTADYFFITSHWFDTSFFYYLYTTHRALFERLNHDFWPLLGHYSRGYPFYPFYPFPFFLDPRYDPYWFWPWRDKGGARRNWLALWIQEVTNLDEELGRKLAELAATFSEEEQWAEIDQDVTQGFGPETITMKQLVDGKYYCTVHNYSAEVRLAGCGATVDFHFQHEHRRFECPAEGQGKWWLVFVLDSLTGAVEVVNQITEYPRGFPWDIP